MIKFLQIVDIFGKVVDCLGDVFNLELFQVEGQIKSNESRLPELVSLTDLALNLLQLFLMQIKQLDAIGTGAETPRAHLDPKDVCKCRTYVIVMD